MFGNKSKENQERLEKLTKELESREEVYWGLAEKAQLWDSNRNEYENSMIHMQNDLKQISENLDAAGAILSENQKLVNAFCETLDVAAKDADGWMQSQKAFIDRLDAISDTSLRTVDNNKHFTDPSKTMSEIAENLKKDYMEHMRQLKTMQDYSKQMSVMALNAAIDAGRMGESGIQFVTSAEAIREYANQYDKSVAELLEQYEDSQTQIAKLEDTVHVLINLLKDNNVSVSKIMKDLSMLVKDGERLNENAPIGVYSQLTDTARLIRDAESEVERMEARNRLQLDDISSEAQLQHKEIHEVFDQITPLIEKTKNVNQQVVEPIQ